jgi:hypothetical protein
MSNNIVSVLTDPTIGGTFLTWSIHYLAGSEKYFLAKTNSWNSICDNPLTKNNAHNFKPNQPSDKNSFELIFNRIVNTDTPDFHTIYFHNFNHVTESYDIELAGAIDRLRKVSSKIIHLTTNKSHFLYNTKYYTRTMQLSWIDRSSILSSSDEIWDDFIKYFFKNSIERWQKLNLNNIWDRREFLALNLFLNKAISITPNIDLKLPHYKLDSFDLYNTFNQTLKNLFDFLELKIDPNQKNKWDLVYQQWQQIHTQSILFVWYFDEIINSILNNYYMDLSRFNLDLIQESAIQYQLLYKHNLNLKTWQLEKFKDTQQLHSLLEPNIHQLQ